MNIANLETFLSVARHGSFAAAGRSLGADPSVVSRSVANLEKEIGIRLFHRNTKRMSLTEAGTIYLRRVEAVVEELEQAKDEALAAVSSVRGTLRITASVAFGQACLVPLLSKFKETLPEVNLELHLTDANVDLVQEGMDLAIRMGPSADQDLIATKLFDAKYCVCASKEFLATSGQLTGPETLKSMDVLLHARPDYKTRWMFHSGGGEIVEVPVSGSIVISNATALKDAMLAGLGAALLPTWLVRREIESGRAIDLFPRHMVTGAKKESGVWILHTSRQFKPAKMRIAIDFLRSSFHENRSVSHRLPARP